MPQMNKEGKFIFGKSLIRTDGTLRIPPRAMEEYHIADEGKVYLFTGSKITGGFCVTRKGLLHPSKLGHILDDTPPLLDYSAGSGEFIKGYRSYRNLSGVELDAKKYEPGDLRWLHKAISNLKAFLLGTYHGRCTQLQSYLDEFCFRFNRRKTGDQIFLRLARTVAASCVQLH